MTNRDYYCSMKFKFLKIDLPSKTIYNCHAAAPHRIDFDWLEENPGNLFNTPVNVYEREQMLRNERNKSCEQNCWIAEDAGAVSPRINQNGIEQTHTDPVTDPEIIDLTIGIDCNLTCSYCCKEYSNSWRRDIINNGNYELTNNTDVRFQGTVKDRVLLGISQPQLKHTRHYQILLKEIERASSKLKKLVITGGEPLLDNQLLSILETLKLKTDAKIELYTGLGMSELRFKNMISKLKNVKNLLIKVSAENIQSHLEFNRYGIVWADFKKKIELMKESNIPFQFHCTLSNLSLFGFKEFYNYYKNEKIDVTFAYQPRMMAPYVLDDISKTTIKDAIELLPKEVKDPIIKSIKNTPTELEKLNIKEFLLEFTKRRQLTLEIFPKSFLEWLQLEKML
jgi:organic radical activating enzyme